MSTPSSVTPKKLGRPCKDEQLLSQDEVLGLLEYIKKNLGRFPKSNRTPFFIDAIADLQLRVTPEEVRKRYNRLVNAYNRYFLKSGDGTRPTWPYYDKMHAIFGGHSVKHRNPFTPEKLATQGAISTSPIGSPPPPALTGAARPTPVPAQAKINESGESSSEDEAETSADEPEDSEGSVSGDSVRHATVENTPSPTLDKAVPTSLPKPVKSNNPAPRPRSSIPPSTQRPGTQPPTTTTAATTSSNNLNTRPSKRRAPSTPDDSPSTTTTASNCATPAGDIWSAPPVKRPRWLKKFLRQQRALRKEMDSLLQQNRFIQQQQANILQLMLVQQRSCMLAGDGISPTPPNPFDQPTHDPAQPTNGHHIAPVNEALLAASDFERRLTLIERSIPSRTPHR
ncbi:hypothetical protein H4R33_002900 [Dimargaris cristalligena]|nr:hypothetical protein H4R33_002900 [Dimargaris cristalligena]